MAGIMATKMMDRIVRPEISYYTLALCILKNITIEEAFHTIAPDPNIRYREIKKKQLAEMVNLRQEGLTYREIGELYGIDAFSVYKRLRKTRGNRCEKRTPGSPGIGKNKTQLRRYTSFD